MVKYVGVLAAFLSLMAVGSFIYINVWMSVGMILHAVFLSPSLYAYRGLPVGAYFDALGNKDYGVEFLVDSAFCMIFILLGYIFWEPLFLPGGYFAALMGTTGIEYLFRLTSSMHDKS